MTGARTTGATWPRGHAAAAALLRAHGVGDADALAPIGEGVFCLAFRRRAHVVRVARHAEAAAALEREACVLPRIADRLPLPVPRPQFARPADGCAFSVHREIGGAALAGDAWGRLPEAVREPAAADLARFLGALHALPADLAAACRVPTLDRAAYAARLRAAAAGGLYGGGMSGPARRRLDAALAGWSRMPEGPARALLHGDLSPDHVLLDPSSGRLTGVIDFGDLALGDPARDFVFIHEDFGAEVLAAVLRHYPGEAAATLLPRMHAWCALEALAWTLARLADGQRAEVEEGLAGIMLELDAMEA